MNANTNTADSRDAHNRAALDPANMFAERAITKATIDGSANTLTLTGGDTITIRHET